MCIHFIKIICSEWETHRLDKKLNKNFQTSHVFSKKNFMYW